MANKLSDLFVKLGLNSSSFNKGIDGAQKKTNAFGKGIAKIGGLIAGAFAIGAIVSFGKELIMLGGVAEGVRSAFNRMAEDNTMRDLQKATAGTVSELELMKRAVSAKNLGLPIKDLANLFEFATKRAQETGESVDFLVNSIVTGIGRKSPLILDNLGISAIELRKQLKGVGFESAQVSDIAAAVGRIAAESMAESGKIIDTNAIKVASLGAKWDDLKLKIAETPVVVDSVSNSIDFLDKALTVLESEHLSFWDKINIFQSQDKTIAKAGAIQQEYTDLTKNSIVELKKLIALEDERYAQLKEESRQGKTVLTEEVTEYFRLKGVMQDIVAEKIKLIDHIDEESMSHRNKIAAEQDAILAEVNHIQTIGELKAETDELKASLDLYNTSQDAELQKTLKQIKANEDLIKQLTTLTTIQPTRGATPATIATRGETPQIGLDFVPETGLANMQSFFDRMDEQLKDFTADYLFDWKELGESLDMLIVDGIVGIADQFGQAIESIFAGDFDIKSLGANLLKNIGDFLGEFGKMLILYGIAQEAFWTSLGLGPLGAGVAIAAGIALVAIGGAISGVGQKVSKGNLSTGGGAGGASGGGFNQGSTRAEDNRVIFELEGTKLVGVIENTSRRTGIIA